MTTPLRSATRPSPISLVEQLGREWSARTAWVGGLAFCERDADATLASRIFAGPMPILAHRGVPAVSLAISATPAPQANEPIVNIGVTAEARGRTQDEVLALLNDFVASVVRPNQRPCAFPMQSNGGTLPDMGGIIGAPPFAAFGGQSTLGVFRVRRLDLLNVPQVIATGAGPASTEEGEISASVSLVAVCTVQVMPAPIAAFTVTLAALTGGGVVVAGNVLTLGIDGGATLAIDLTNVARDTIAELFAAGAAGWTFGSLNGAVSARASIDLVPMAVELDGPGSVTVYVRG